MTKSLGEALPEEIARVRDELLPAYYACGPSGVFAATMMHRALDRASRAMIEGDLPAMIRCYEELKSFV